MGNCSSGKKFKCETNLNIILQTFMYIIENGSHKDLNKFFNKQKININKKINGKYPLICLLQNLNIDDKLFKSKTLNLEDEISNLYSEKILNIILLFNNGLDLSQKYYIKDGLNLYNKVNYLKFKLLNNPINMKNGLTFSELLYKIRDDLLSYYMRDLDYSIVVPIKNDVFNIKLISNFNMENTILNRNDDNDHDNNNNNNSFEMTNKYYDMCIKYSEFDKIRKKYLVLIEHIIKITNHYVMDNLDKLNNLDNLDNSDKLDNLDNSDKLCDSTDGSESSDNYTNSLTPSAPRKEYVADISNIENILISKHKIDYTQ
jgi:hypothetical protein